MTLVLAACEGTSSDVIVWNRTNANIAILPGIAVAACSSAGFDRASLEAATDRFMAGDPVAPAGYVEWHAPAISAPRGAPRPVTLVITSRGGDVVFGEVGADGVPPCEGGAPEDE